LVRCRNLPQRLRGLPDLLRQDQPVQAFGDLRLLDGERRVGDRFVEGPQGADGIHRPHRVEGLHQPPQRFGRLAAFSVDENAAQKVFPAFDGGWTERTETEAATALELPPQLIGIGPRDREVTAHQTPT
jgi:hypothetical protein